MLRVIIVDDEQLSLKRLNKILSESGKIESCHSFLNPFEACEFVKTNDIDIAFLDISMPEMNGMTLSNTLRAINQSIIIVFVTSYDDYAVQAFDVRASDYLMKPVTAQRIAKTLDRVTKSEQSTVIQPTLGVHLFNGLKLFRKGDDATPLKLRSPKTEELFSFLIYKKSVSREEIIETLWSGMTPDRALKNLNSNLHYIRKAIDSSQSGKYIQAGRSEISIVENDIYCDLYEFDQLLNDARRGININAEFFKRAEALYTGELLKGKPYEWAAAYARQIEYHYIALLEDAAAFHNMQDRLQKALYYFDKILTLDTMREDIHHEVIRLYIQLGRKNEAIRQYHFLEETLLQELGTKPDQRITDAILNMSR